LSFAGFPQIWGLKARRDLLINKNTIKSLLKTPCLLCQKKARAHDYKNIPENGIGRKNKINFERYKLTPFLFFQRIINIQTRKRSFKNNLKDCSIGNFSRSRIFIFRIKLAAAENITDPIVKTQCTEKIANKEDKKNVDATKCMDR